ncbi:hypothetical protein [Actinomyces sp.]|uniref:hypothetical protein n=1 Tax=Actinomyces sp. TaxID=29317 RepID=UPI0026DB606E|nr:hypothetical protein [Actinomyces sp.]MDO4901886.1 hypothetical protein [Actinomyces sp.]
MSQAIGDGSWVQGSLAGVGLAGDMLFTVTNPIAAGVSVVVGWIIEHIYPLDEMLNQLTGDAEAVMAGAQTWTNISGAYTQQATALRDHLTADMADQAGQAADAWRARAGKLAGGMNTMSSAAANIAKGLEIAAAIVQFVHDMVRDAISEAIGMFFQAAAEEIFSLGLATPLVAGQISTWVANKVVKLASKVKDLVNSFAALSRLLRKVQPGLTKLMAGLKKLDLSEHAANAGRRVGRNIKNHMGGSTPKHHTPTLTATHTSASGGGGTNASTTTTSSGGHTSSTGSGSVGSSSSGGSSSVSGPGSSSPRPGGAGAAPGGSSASGGSGTSYHGIDPIHGDTSIPSSAHSTTSSSTNSGTTPAASTADATYHGIDPIHGDTRAPSSAHSAAHANTGTTADSPHARSGSDGGRTSTPDASTGRTDADRPDGSARDRSSTAADQDTGSRDGSGRPGRSEQSTPAGDDTGTQSSRTHAPDGQAPEATRPHSDRAPEGDRPDAQRTSDTGDSKTGGDSEPEPTNRDGSDTDTEPRGRSDAGGDPDARDRSGHDHAEQPDQHRKQAPDGRTRDTDSPGPEHPKSQEPKPEPAPTHTDPEHHSHSTTAAADSTTPHGKTDDTPDPTNHKDSPDGNTDTTHKSNNEDTSNDHAHDDKAADKDAQHETNNDHGAGDHADGGGADGSDGDVDDRYQKSVPELFEDREGFVNQRDEFLGELDASMPDGLERSAFNVENRQQTIRSLVDDGYDPEEVERLRQMARDLTKARQDVSETSAAIGEVGGQRYSDTHGAPVLDAWRNENNGSTPPGGYSDGAALSSDGKTFYELEYKGVTAKLSKTPVHTTFEGVFPQGTPEYARDHLITDPRYAQYFHDHKDVWEAIKSGKTSLCFRTISTRTAHGKPHVQDVPFNLVGDGPNGHKVRDTLQEMIDALD